MRPMRPARGRSAPSSAAAFALTVGLVGALICTAGEVALPHVVLESGYYPNPMRFSAGWYAARVLGFIAGASGGHRLEEMAAPHRLENW